MKILENENIPAAAGHYSMCVEHNGTLYLAGQLPRDPQSGTIPAGISAQTRQALENVRTILEAVGCNKNHVIQMRIYIAEIELWDEVNAIYAEFFGDHRPARTVVPVKTMHYGSLIEVEAVAAMYKI